MRITKNFCRHFLTITLLAIVLASPVHALESGPFQFYGFVKSDVSIASQAVSSLGSYSSTGTGSWSRVNSVAVTEAAPLGLSGVDLLPRSSFQFGQSRFGMTAVVHALLKANFEFDLVDFDRSAATVAVRPRIRLARILYSPDEQNDWVIGQDWDLLSAVKPFTFNFVHLFFRSGNVAFLRPQVSWIHRWEPGRYSGWETGVMVGSAGVNDSSSNDSALERGLLPVVAVRLQYRFTASTRAGLAAEGTSRRFESVAGQNVALRRGVWSTEAFAEWGVGSEWVLRANAYVGQNMKSIGAFLTLSEGSYSQTQKEWGGFISGQWKGEKHQIQTSGGLAQLLRGEVAPTGTLRQNAVLKLSYAYSPIPSLQLYSELSEYFSRYRMASQLSQAATATVLELGGLLNF